MYYQIIPLEMGSLVERNLFQKSNKEIKCGMVWKLGSVITESKPTFIKAYDPNIGICIEDIPGGAISKTYGGEKVIYFSDTIEEDEQDELTEIFYQSNKKYSKSYEDVFHDLGWKQVSSDSYIFGELEIKELDDALTSYK
ncbi:MULTISPECIES: hypothetical protein [unclassified Polynucleobacter]|jgi:hypothetical protein|uniref:hypothetical protein n=1 Tax=unclassified Polynucleobacter TaxID=2640945 RepID=UPI001BFE4CCE|nr:MULTISPECIES: hypothetical protein [unclassified Polynucleobacter]MBU3639451.1 hypothetical protein [Polynucleobacter sp. AP-RePozz3-80-G7]QWD80969.1 hypothetical protein C2755_06740 [Polynucleobacter sp. MWH-S4W17]